MHFILCIVFIVNDNFTYIYIYIYTYVYFIISTAMVEKGWSVKGPTLGQAEAPPLETNYSAMLSIFWYSLRP